MRHCGIQCHIISTGWLKLKTHNSEISLKHWNVQEYSLNARFKCLAILRQLFLSLTKNIWNNEEMHFEKTLIQLTLLTKTALENLHDCHNCLVGQEITVHFIVWSDKTCWMSEKWEGNFRTSVKILSEYTCTCTFNNKIIKIQWRPMSYFLFGWNLRLTKDLTIDFLKCTLSCSSLFCTYFCKTYKNYKLLR